MKKVGIISIVLFSLTCVYTCKHNGKQENLSESITILYTNDEHGWMEASEDQDGAAGMVGLWKEQEGYDGSDNFLVLSGGDNWTGPAISTWFQGESMVEVMNAMDYDATALGNHEFDFKLDGLERRVNQMSFPIVCANITNRSDGSIPDFVQPYIIQEAGDVKVGVLGLANTVTPHMNFSYVGDTYEFGSYAAALDEYVPEMRSEGADIIILITHLCNDDVQALVPDAKEHGISIIGGGHCHHPQLVLEDGVLLMDAGAYYRGYISVEIKVDKNEGSVDFIEYKLVENKNAEADQSIANIVENWQLQIEEELSGIIGYSEGTIESGSEEMANLITDSWLFKFPDADISVTNSGGIRQDIPSGDISKNTIVGLLPFENEILGLELTGEQVIDCIGDYLLVGGISTINGYKHSDGTPMVMDSVYTVLTTDYIYSLSTNNFDVYDDTPAHTGLNWREPLMEYLESIATSSTDPLQNYLDYSARR
jgi:5'-nucleotidase/UDP-sugar diphosphatase